MHVTERDRFSANGVTLRGDAYRTNTRVTFSSSGDVTGYFGAGVLEKVLLPDGRTFMGAGRVKVLAQPPGFIVAPDTGVAKNQGDFCATLSG